MQSSLGLPQIRSVPEPRFAYLARGLVPDAGHLQRTFGRGLAFDFYSPFQYLSAGGGSLGGPLSIQARLVRLDDLTVLWADSCSFDAGSFPPPLLFSRIANVEQLYTPAALDWAAGCGDTPRRPPPRDGSVTMRTVFATAVALVLAQGCTVLEVREISRAALESPAQGTIDDEGYVRLPGVRVAATARNDRVSTVMIGPAYFPIFPLPAGILSPAEAAPYFWIDVAIDPEGEAFTFDPREVRLHIEPGSSLVPSLTKGPTMVLPPYSRRHS